MSNQSMNNIHWFPGHMKKALNQIKEKINLVDIVIEIVDARIPNSSFNMYLEDSVKEKPRFLILSKEDLADPIITKKWKDHFISNGYNVVSLNLNSKDVFNIINKEVDKIVEFKKEKWLKKGMKPQPVKTMIIGIPNVGKSTLINKLSKRKAAGVENRPGYTKSQQWIRVSDLFYLLDTPGVLPMNYENQDTAIKLALVGSIKEEILPIHVICDYLINHFKNYYPKALSTRFNINDLTCMDNEMILFEVAKIRGLKKGNDFDLDKARILLLKEYKDGLLGRVSLDVL